MTDRAIGLFGINLALVSAVITLIPGGAKLAAWLIYGAFCLGIFLSGLALGLMIPREQTSLPTQPTSSPAMPDLRISLVGGNVFVPDAEDSRTHLTGIALNAKVWNTGSPSVLTKWTLFVIPQNTTPLIAQLSAIPEALRLGGPLNSAVI